MTKREGAILTAFTGICIGEFHEAHKYMEEIMGRPLFTHELASKDLVEEIKERVRPDFIKLCETMTN